MITAAELVSPSSLHVGIVFGMHAEHFQDLLPQQLSDIQCGIVTCSHCAVITFPELTLEVCHL